MNFIYASRLLQYHWISSQNIPRCSNYMKIDFSIKLIWFYLIGHSHVKSGYVSGTLGERRWVGSVDERQLTRVERRSKLILHIKGLSASNYNYSTQVNTHTYTQCHSEHPLTPSPPPTLRKRLPSLFCFHPINSLSSANSVYVHMENKEEIIHSSASFLCGYSSLFIQGKYFWRFISLVCFHRLIIYTSKDDVTDRLTNRNRLFNWYALFYGAL